MCQPVLHPWLKFTMLQLKFADSPASMMVWRVRWTGPEYPSVGSAAPGTGTSGISFNVTTFMTLSPLLPSLRLFIGARPFLARRSCTRTSGVLRRHAGYQFGPKVLLMKSAAGDRVRTLDPNFADWSSECPLSTRYRRETGTPL